MFMQSYRHLPAGVIQSSKGRCCVVCFHGLFDLTTKAKGQSGDGSRLGLPLVC